MKINAGKTICSLRKSHALTQQQIADMINVSRPTYTSWEKNNGELTLSKILCLIDVYKIKFTDFLHMLEMENNITLISKQNLNDTTLVFINHNATVKEPAHLIR